MGDMTDEDTSATASIPEIGITADDQDRIREYIDKPPHLRSLHDLIPDTDGSTD